MGVGVASALCGTECESCDSTRVTVLLVTVLGPTIYWADIQAGPLPRTPRTKPTLHNILAGSGSSARLKKGFRWGGWAGGFKLWFFFFTPLTVTGL